MRPLTGAEYPYQLRDLPEPPDPVFVAGVLPRIPAVAIVGTRTPSAPARAFARRLARSLAAQGVAVFSGGAKGIDTAAHRGALDAGGVTVVVAPSSFDHPFPPENGALFREIVEKGGAFLTRYLEGTKPDLNNFFGRNAMLAALTQALVIVETRYRGGARNAARAARRLGRPVLVVPSAPWIKSGTGCHLEIRAGATIVVSAADVLEAIGLAREGPHVHARMPALAPARAHAREGLRPASLPLFPFPQVADPVAVSLLKILAKGPLWPDEICRKLGLTAARVQALLLTLTLESVLVSEPSGRISLIKY